MEKNMLGNYLKNLRKQHGLTLKALSDQLGLSHQIISYVERGERLISIYSLKKYADFFNVDFDFLIDLLDKQRALKARKDDGLQTPEIEELDELLTKMNPTLLNDFITSIMDITSQSTIKPDDDGPLLN